MESITNLLTFVRIAEAGSVRGGAERLGVTVSAASKALQRLEARMGVPLVRRNSRGLSLTDDGEALLAHGRRIMLELDAAETMLSSAKRSLGGRVRVSLPVAFGRMYVLPLIVDFLRHHPGVALDLRLDDRFSDLIGDGVDLAIRMTRDPPRSTQLVARRITSSHLVLCGSPDYLRKYGEPRSREELAHHTCLAFSHNGLPYRYRLARGKAVLDHPVVPRMAVDNGEALRDVALAGFGLCQLHSYIAAPDIEAGRLKPVLLDCLAPPIDIYVVYGRRDPVLPKVRKLVDCLVAGLKEPSPWHRCLQTGRVS